MSDAIRLIPDVSMSFKIGDERFTLHKKNGPLLTQMGKLHQQLESGRSVVSFLDEEGEHVEIELTGKTRRFPPEFKKIAGLTLNEKGEPVVLPVHRGEDLHAQHPSQRGSTVTPDGQQPNGQVTPIVNVALDRKSLAEQQRANLLASVADAEGAKKEAAKKGIDTSLPPEISQRLERTPIMQSSVQDLAKQLTEETLSE